MTKAFDDAKSKRTLADGKESKKKSKAEVPKEAKVWKAKKKNYSKVLTEHERIGKELGAVRTEQLIGGSKTITHFNVRQ